LLFSLSPFPQPSPIGTSAAGCRAAVPAAPRLAGCLDLFCQGTAAPAPAAQPTAIAAALRRRACHRTAMEQGTSPWRLPTLPGPALCPGTPRASLSRAEGLAAVNVLL